MTRNILLRFFCFLWTALAFAQQPVHLKVDASQVVREIDPKIYGQFLEHIYHSVNGGVWGEAVWNRSFEERLSQDDWRVRGGVLVTPPAADRESRFIVGSAAWGDYDFFVDARKNAGTGALAVGIFNARTPTKTPDLVLEDGRWYRVHVRVTGRRVQAFLDDKPAFDVTNETANV